MVLLTALILAGILAAPAGGQSPDPTGSAPAPSAEEWSGDSLFPAMVADEREPRFLIRVLRDETPDLDTDVMMFGLGDRIGLFGSELGRGWQLGVDVSGGILARFDLAEPTFDFLDADFVVGIPIAVRRGGWSARMRIYHQSSHLGDDYLRTRETLEERTFDYEAIEAAVSLERRWARLYGGAEHRFRHTPESVARQVAFAGAEVRQSGGLLRLGNRRVARAVMAFQVTGSAERGWHPSWAGRVGVEVADRKAGARARRLMVLLEAFDGPSQRGQFYLEDQRFVGIGVHFTPWWGGVEAP